MIELATQAIKSSVSQVRTSSEILHEIGEIKGVNAVVVVGRDGFVIESVGHMPNANLDVLGAAVATAIHGITEMGAELNVGNFADVFVTFKTAMIMCFPVGDAICGIAGEDASTLGLIRHKTRKLIPELEQHL